jgi:hypothetical protein
MMQSLEETHAIQQTWSRGSHRSHGVTETFHHSPNLESVSALTIEVNAPPFKQPQCVKARPTGSSLQGHRTEILTIRLLECENNALRFGVLRR